MVTHNFKFCFHKLPCTTVKFNYTCRSKTEIWNQKKGGWENEKMYYTFLPQPVSPAAMKASASPRVETLAEHKQIHRDFKPERPVRLV